MIEALSAFAAFLTDAEGLKLVSRRAYVRDMSRNENLRSKECVGKGCLREG